MARKKAADAGLEDEGGVLDFAQAAALLGISRSTLSRMVKQGRVRGFKVGRQWRFRRSDLDKFTKMSHPSAASVNVTEVLKVLSGMGARVTTAPVGTGDRLSIEPRLPDYPATEEEKAIEQVFRTVLASALRARATDIHIEPAHDATLVRQRIDGVLHEMLRLPRSAHSALAACIKAHARLQVDQQNIPQDGRFHLDFEGAPYAVRIGIVPSTYGESVTMRLLARTGAIAPLDQLGMGPEDLARYQRALSAPVGLLLVTGPTGSGRTTTLYAGLQQVASPQIKTLTVEDPVEYTFPYVTSVPVNVKAGVTFEHALRALMRQDPDVVLLGEIRTLEAAEICTQIALTGHLAMSTLHARTAAGAIARLTEMGVEPFITAESLLCVVAMRLARRVCPKCAAADNPSFTVLSRFAERARAGGYELPDGVEFKRGKGCDNCRQTGYRGRIGVFEVLQIDSDLARMIADRASAGAIEEAAVKKGLTTLAADGLRKAVEGITSVTEAMRVTAESWG